jgi:hypothetical protein
MPQTQNIGLTVQEDDEAARRVIAAADMEDLTADLAVISLGINRIAKDPLYEEEIEFTRSPRASRSGGSTIGSCCDTLGGCFPCTASQGSCVPGCSTYGIYDDPV